jgi:hypothetical protein
LSQQATASHSTPQHTKAHPSSAHPPVVLAHVDHRQRPQLRHVDRLKDLALVRGAVAVAGHGNVGAPRVLVGWGFADYGVRIIIRFPDAGVRIINRFPDYGVRIINRFPDAGVRIIIRFPDAGVRVINRFPDYGVRVINRVMFA